ncbi:MAG: helicase-related protein, partial [Candidatus Bathyarchaeia archaeon]
LTQQEQIKMLEDFRNGKLNVLVATSIAEEGLDIPSVDLVIFYEPIPSEIRYIQRKGRTGRKKFGKAVILVTKGTSDIAYFYASRKKAEKMRKIIKVLNQKLRTFQRSGSKPAPNQLTEEEIKEIEELARLEEESKEPLKIALKPLVKVEKTKLKEFEGKRPGVDISISYEDAVKQTVYIKALEAGLGGKTIDELIKECMDMGFEQTSIMNAIKKLLESGKLSQIGLDKIFAKPLKDLDENVHLVEVLRIEPGKAKVLIDDKYEAMILPGDFNAPLSILKRYAKFKAKGEFYNGLFRVSEVIEVLPS